jgi:hypothetical protein
MTIRVAIAPPVKKVQYRNQEPRGNLIASKKLKIIINKTIDAVLGINT